MAKFDDFDPSDYMSTPRLDVPSLIAGAEAAARRPSRLAEGR